MDKALELNLSALKFASQSNDKVFLIWIYNDIGVIYNKLNNKNEALLYFQKALSTSMKINNPLGKSKTMNHIGEVYLKQRNYTKASQYFFDALKNAKEAEAKDNINEIYKNISEYYASFGNYKEALKYHKLYKELSDSILNQNKIKNMVEMQARYDLKDAENRNHLLQKNIEINNLTIKKNKIIRIFLMVSLFLTLLLIVLIYSRLIVKRKKNKELNEKNTIIFEQKTQLSTALVEQQKLNKTLNEQKEELLLSQKKLAIANVELEKTNHTKDKFLSIIAHDLRGSIGNIISFSTLIHENINKYSKDELSDLFLLMENAATNTFQLLENLLTWARSQKGEISFKPRLNDIKETIEESIDVFELKALNKNIKVINNCTEPCVCTFDKDMIRITLNNLLNNATKYSSRNGTIKINAQIIKHQLEVSVSDNGMGIKPEILDTLFKINSEHVSEEGTEGEKGTGLGLVICKEFIEKHGGKIWVQSEEGKGSTFYFNIPCNG